jgi:hypothetical protein
MLQSLLLVACLTVQTTLVHAHGAMSAPLPAFADISNKNAPSASLPGPAGPYTGTDEVKSLLEKAGGSKCGKTNANAAVQPAPSDGVVAFAISAQHIGPCEIWLDDTKVVSATDCWKQFPDKRIPVDFSKCVNKASCELRWIWMATHTSPWEFYDNCVRVGTGAGGSSSNQPTNATTPSPRPVPAATPTQTTLPSPSPTQTPLPSPSPSTAEPLPGTVRPPSQDTSTGKCVRGVGGDKSLDAWCTANCAMNFCPATHCEPCA